MLVLLCRIYLESFSSFAITSLWKRACCFTLFVFHENQTSICLDPHQKYGLGWYSQTCLSLPVLFVLTVPRWFYFCGSFLLCVSCLSILLACLFLIALWSPAGKGLTSWLLYVMFLVFLSLSHVMSLIRCVA